MAHFYRFSSRKLLVVLMATVLLWYDKIASDDWMFICCVYIGVNAVQKIGESVAARHRNPQPRRE